MILVTTAGKVGTEAALLLRQRELPVRVLVRDPGKAKTLADAGAEVAAGDLGVPASIDAAMTGVTAVILVSPAVPAGVSLLGPAELATEEEFDKTFAVNVKVPFFLVAALAPAMAERGAGAIVSISSMVASFGQPGMAMYGASRAAIELLTKAWAAEFGPHGVRVNAVAPAPRAPR